MLFESELIKFFDELAEVGFVLFRANLSVAFKQHLQNFHQMAMAGLAIERGDGYVAGKKRQYLYEFESDAAADEFRRQISAVTGLNEATFTISERHLKVYDDAAMPLPAPHKDRNASTYSIGIPIKLTKDTGVAFFPNMDRSPNTEERAQFVEGLNATELEALYGSDEAKFVDEEEWDLIVFEGSAMFHERTYPAGTAVLYIKVNDNGMDPLGEDIYSRRVAKRSMVDAEQPSA